MSPKLAAIIPHRKGGRTALRKMKVGQFVTLRDTGGNPTSRGWIKEVFLENFIVGKLGLAVQCTILPENDNHNEFSAWVYPFDVLNIKELLEK